jgi:hypothetical protein
VHDGEAEGRRARWRAAAVEEEEAGVEAVAEETGVEWRRGDRQAVTILE